MRRGLLVALLLTGLAGGARAEQAAAKPIPLPPQKPGSLQSSNGAAPAPIGAPSRNIDFGETGAFSEDAFLPGPAPVGRLPAPQDETLAPPAAATASATAGDKSGQPPDLAYGAFQRGLYLTAFGLAIQRAEKGDPIAQTLIGLMYEAGYGIPRDYAKALQWYGLAAKAGDRDAQFAVGMMLASGRGAAKDQRRAAQFFQAAAAQGQTGADYQLALLYLDGTAVPRDDARAAALLAKAAEAENPDAQYQLAQLYDSGIGVHADPSEAVRWYGAAARLGNVVAQIEYAVRLFNGVGVARDPVAAAGWFERAANAGNPIAQNRLARILAVGAGHAPDAVAAAKWHLLAKGAGKDDPWLDDFVAKLSAQQRQTASAEAERWPAN